MNKKYLLLTLALSTSFLLAITIVQAAPIDPSRITGKNSITTGKNNVTPSPNLTQAAKKDNLVKDLKTRATNEINRRLTALNGLVTKVNGLRRLTADQKAALTSQIQAQIANLTNLQGKIQADTDITTLRNDVKSIVDSYRIFALYLPQVHILAYSEAIQESIGSYNSLATKLQTLLSNLKSKGVDVTSLETTLSDLQSKLNDAQNQAQQAEATVAPLTPDGYPENKTVLQNAQKMLEAARQDLRGAYKDGQTVIQGIKELRKNLTPTPSLTGSSTSTKAANP